MFTSAVEFSWMKLEIVKVVSFLEIIRHSFYTEPTTSNIMLNTSLVLVCTLGPKYTYKRFLIN